MEIIKEESLLENAAVQGEYLQSHLNQLSLDFPGYVTNPRGVGLWTAFDLPSSTERDELWSQLMKNDLLILVSGDKSIRFRPHLNVKSEDIDKSIEIISKSIKEILR